ncbi:BON domain-containing protein [Paraburkholderia sediminicola]|uniref:BON domain-containing protein n=1 Tax=Paraburkholderia sediminicola TaxID=458836 RepID=UPI0038B8B6D7
MKLILILFAALCAASAVFAQTNMASNIASQQALPSHEAPRKQSPDDKALDRAVRRQLGRTHGLDATGISVRSHGGVVWLAGTVSDPAQIDLAAQVVRTVAGVSSVVNKLTLRAPM